MRSPLDVAAALVRARRTLAAAVPGTDAHARALERVRDFEDMASPDDQIDDFPNVATKTKPITAEQQVLVQKAYDQDVAIGRTTTVRRPPDTSRR